jgi:hypothetical protein
MVGLGRKTKSALSNYDSIESKAPLTVRFAIRLSNFRFWPLRTLAQLRI